MSSGLIQLGRCISRVRIVLERSRVAPSNFHVLLSNATGTNNETTQGLFKSSLCPKPLTTLQPPLSFIQNLYSASITIVTVAFVCHLLIPVYVSLKEHPSCVSPPLPPLCWPHSVPKPTLCLRTTNTVASLMVSHSHSHGAVMVL